MKLRLVMALVLCAASARADKAGDALRLLDEGIKQFNAGELQEARESFSRARDLVPDKANPYRWLGLVDARLGRCGDAIKELEIFLQKVPPNDSRVAEAVTLRDRCREDLQPRVGGLSVESTPAGAEVRLDDPSSPVVGVTPWRSDSVSVGNHVIFVAKSGYEPITRGVGVAARETARVTLTLVPSSGRAVADTTKRQDTTLVRGNDRPIKKKPYWIAGVVIGVVAAAGLAVGLGVGLTQGGNQIQVFDPVGPP
jgi:hypothetical protein